MWTLLSNVYAAASLCCIAAWALHTFVAWHKVRRIPRHALKKFEQDRAKILMDKVHGSGN